MEDAQPKIDIGLKGIYFSESKICKVESSGHLYYSGYPIEEIADASSFEEVCYLLLHGELPSSKELSDFCKTLSERRPLDDDLVNLIKGLSGKTHPMHILSTAMDMVGARDKNSDSDAESNIERSVNIISKIASIAATIGGMSNGKNYTEPDQSMGHVENFLYMLDAQRPTTDRVNLMDLMFVLHAEHGSNASTFSSIVTASTLSDIYSAVVSGINTLKGPLHGGADERALQMLYGLEGKDILAYIDGELSAHSKIMGFGHRIYKAHDPRALIIKAKLESVLPNSTDEVKTLAQTAFKVEEEMEKRVGSKGIWSNLDFFSGPVYRHMGIPPGLFTPIFAVSRSPGWCAHVIEYWKHNRLIRPISYYTGSRLRHYVPIEKR